MQRLDIDDRGKAALLAPGKEFSDRTAIGAPRVRIADVVDEELPKARLSALAAIRGVIAITEGRAGRFLSITRPRG